MDLAFYGSIIIFIAAYEMIISEKIDRMVVAVLFPGSIIGIAEKMDIGYHSCNLCICLSRSCF